MSTDTKIQQWKTEIQENGFSEIKNIQLILWNTGICLAGYNKEQKFVYAQADFFKEKWSIKSLQHFIENTPLLSGTEPITHIWIAEERNLLVPKKLFNQNEAENWLQKLHFIDEREQINFNYIATPPSYTVYPIHSKVIAIFNDYYPDAQIEFLGAAFWKGKNKNANISLVLLNDYAIISAFKSQGLQNHLQFNFENADDIVYKIGSVANHCDIIQDNILLNISGIGENYTKLKDELNYFFKFQETENATNDYVNLFQSIAI